MYSIGDAKPYYCLQGVNKRKRIVLPFPVYKNLEKDTLSFSSRVAKNKENKETITIIAYVKNLFNKIADCCKKTKYS